MLRRGRFLTGAYDEEIGVKDVTWLRPDGEEMTHESWEDGHARCLGVLLDGRAQETGIRRVGDDSTLLIITNSHTEVVPCILPRAVGGGAGSSCWIRTSPMTRNSPAPSSANAMMYRAALCCCSCCSRSARLSGLQQRSARSSVSCKLLRRRR